MNKIVIIGSEGQDGKLLYERLKKTNDTVFQISKESTKKNGKSFLPKIDITKKEDIKNFLKDSLPSEIYYLASHHHNSEYKQNHNLSEFKKSYQINVKSFLYFLDAIRFHSPNTKIFYSASSHIFGSPYLSPQDEKTQFDPATIYGMNKTHAIYISRLYRKSYNIFSCVGILYTHESKYRKSHFLSKRIVRKAIDIANGDKTPLEVANPDANIDWGYAGDYVRAMKLIMEQGEPDEFVISSGEKSKLRDFISYVFEYLNLDYRNHITLKENILRRKQIANLFGNSSKLIAQTGWAPTMNLKKLAHKLVEDELNLSK